MIVVVRTVVDEDTEIPKDYITTEGWISKTEKVDFQRYFLNTLLADKKLSKYVLASKSPEGKEYKDPERSSRIDALISSLAGATWEEIPAGFILFDGCPLKFIKIRQEDWWVYLMYSTPELLKKSFGDLIIKRKIVRSRDGKKIVAVEFRGKEEEVPRLSQIKNDQELIEKILLLFKSGLLAYKDLMDDHKSNEIRFIVAKNPFRRFGGDKAQYGRIELGFDTRVKEINKMRLREQVNYALLCKTAFEVMNNIAGYLEPMWTR